MASKTTQNGYMKLPNGQWLHFSMNAWANLQELTGSDLVQWNKEFDKTSTDIDKILAYADLAYAGAMAYNQENDIDIDFNIYNVRNWIEEQFTKEVALEFFKAVFKSNEVVKSGKKTGKSKK